jgi:hypothetical protein
MHHYFTKILRIQNLSLYFSLALVVINDFFLFQNILILASWFDKQVE